MQKRFKKEFENSKVTIKSPSIGKVEIDTTASDANKWAAIPEFAHMFEDDIEEEVYVAPKRKAQPTKTKEVEIEHTDQPPNKQFGVHGMSLPELRKKFPDVKATSKAKFLELIGQ